MMFYSIIEVDDQGLKDRLAVTCDDQPFIARAPWVLVFVADFQKWMDLFAVAGVERIAGRPHDVTPELADSCSPVATRSSPPRTRCRGRVAGIGSCYIGDILELGETHAELLRLPRYTFPVAMLCLGRPKSRPRIANAREEHGPQEHLPPPDRRNCATRTSSTALRRARLRTATKRPGHLPPKFAADFAAEANRSVAWWLERWMRARLRPGRREQRSMYLSNCGTVKAA